MKDCVASVASMQKNLDHILNCGKKNMQAAAEEQFLRVSKMLTGEIIDDAKKSKRAIKRGMVVLEGNMKKIVKAHPVLVQTWRASLDKFKLEATFTRKTCYDAEGLLDRMRQVITSNKIEMASGE